MTDVFNKNKRSQIMSRIGGKNTKPEIIVRKLLHSLGYRFRLHRKDLPGKPDIILPRWKAVIFVHGCFWHGHKGCKRAGRPQTHADFWKNKIEGNMKRDAANIEQLVKLGYRCLVIWQCETKEIEILREKLTAFLPR